MESGSALRDLPSAMDGRGPLPRMRPRDASGVAEKAPHSGPASLLSAGTAAGCRENCRASGTILRAPPCEFEKSTWAIMGYECGRTCDSTKTEHSSLAPVDGGNRGNSGDDAKGRISVWLAPRACAALSSCCLWSHRRGVRRGVSVLGNRDRSQSSVAAAAK